MVENNNNFKILIVDDSEINIQVLSSIIRTHLNIQISATSRPEEVFNICMHNKPDLILLDIMMPGIDGFEVCLILKKDTFTASIPIIFITSSNLTEHIVKGFELGAVDYITKPFRAEELILRIRNQIRLQTTIKEKRQLLQILCHDLSKPFASIISLIELLDDEPTEFQFVRDNILNLSKNGLELIELVRTMRYIEDKNQPITLEPVNILDCIKESLLILGSEILRKKIRFTMYIKEELNVLAERTSFINSVLNNILSNSIKFSYSGSNIDIKAVEEEEFVKLFIKDHGIGIPEEILKDIFEYTRTKSRTGTEGELGTGFGMPLVKKFIQIYGGDIKIISTEEKQNNKGGTEIHLKLKKVK